MMNRLDKAPRGLPGPLGVVPASVPVGAAEPPVRERAAQAYAAAGVEPPAALAAAEPEELQERKEKVGGYYAYPSDLARIKAAWFHTQTTEDGYPSISEMTVQVLLAEAERLEKAHNGGQPFPDVPAGKVRHSRKA